MSEYDDLKVLGVVFRPISSWPGGPAAMHRDRVHSPFRATFKTTAVELGRELRMLGARKVVVEIALGEGDFRTTDGLPRAQAKARHPGVVVSIADSDHGTMRYACDKFWSWQENLRGIAKGMEAQRLLARYGIAERGEQYAGWKQLAQTTMSTAEAEAVLIAHAGGANGHDKATARPRTGGASTAPRSSARTPTAAARRTRWPRSRTRPRSWG